MISKKRCFFSVIAAESCMLVFFFLFTPAAFAKIMDKIVAVINDEVITLSELKATVALEKSAFKDAGKPGAEAVVTEEKILDALVKEKLIKQASDRVGIEVSDEEIENAVKAVQEQNGFNRKELMMALAASGLTYDEYRDRLREQIRSSKFLDMRFRSRIHIKPDEVDNYYRQHLDKFYGPPSYRISLIFIDGEDERRAAKRLYQVENGLKDKIDFAALARLYSDDESAASGGDLGSVKAGEFNEFMESAILKLSLNDVSPPIRRPEGIYFIKFIEYHAGEPAPLEKVRDVIYQSLFERTYAEMVETWFEDEKELASIDIRL
ncbi:MAG: SurA N-terminal domain-containing protein [Thermodesulfobacteriota bacterium]